MVSELFLRHATCSAQLFDAQTEGNAGCKSLHTMMMVRTHLFVHTPIRTLSSSFRIHRKESIGRERLQSDSRSASSRERPCCGVALGQNDDMTNLANSLKSEITRIARKEVRSDIAVLKKALGTYRSEIAALKRRARALEQAVRRIGREAPKGRPSALGEPATATQRFSARGLASQRQRLDLSAAECGLLVGASAQSIYNWESASARPREKHLAAIAGLKAMGKKEAAARLASAPPAGAKG